MKKIKVSIFDDNATRRKGLSILINSVEGMECIAEYADCSNVLQHVSNTTPDVILMDIDMPNVNGIEGVKEIRSKFSDIKIIMQTVFEDDDKIFAAICAGADGYILKKTAPSKLLDGIIEVMQGGAPMSPSIANQVLKLFKHQNKKEVIHIDLSTREQEILALLVQGLSYKMIGEKCNISYSTVNTHIKHIYEKLHVNSAVEAVTKAIENRMV